MKSGLSGRFGISNHIRRYLFEKNDSKCERYVVGQRKMSLQNQFLWKSAYRW